MAKKIDLNSYIGKEIKCSCGRVHSSTVKAVDIDAGAVIRLPGFLKKMGYKNIFLVADINTWKAAGARACEELTKSGISVKKIILQYEELVPDEQVLGEVFAAYPMDTDLVLAVGSGTINDICKFVSYQMKTDYVIFASAPSMDGFVSVGAALMIDHVKTTYDTHGPVAVFGDTDILAQAPMNMITAGLGDILGKYTCLLDWKMANLIEGEYYCKEIVDMVKEAIEIVVEQGPKIKDRNPEAVKAVTEALVLTGMAMSFIGNSRPASGCEHHLSHYWEMKFIMEGKKPILHGTKVGVGMVTASCLYHMLSEENVDFEQAMRNGFDYERWAKKVTACYEEATPGIIQLEEQCGKNNLEKRNRRISYLKENWTLIQNTIKKALPKVETIEQLLTDLDAPINPEQIGVSMELVKDGIILAKEVRNRFTLLQILWDLGLAETYAERMTDYFTGKQNVYLAKKKEIFRQKLNKIKCVILDMDGTIYLEDQLFPFTKKFLEKVTESGREYYFYTNNSSKNQGDYLGKLEKMNIPVTPAHMLLSTQVAVNYFLKKHKNAAYYVVGTPNLLAAFADAGLTLTEENPDVVVLGFDTTLTYEKMEKACRFIRHGAIYFGVNPDYNCPVKDGEYIPDCGSMAKMIEQSTGRFPEFFGKPSRYTYDFILEKTGYAQEEVAFIGDRIYTDIAVANGTDSTSIMVLTGETQVKDLAEYDYGPDMIVDSLEELIPLL